MNKYGRNGCILAKEGMGDDLVEILLEAANLVSTMKGCQQYLIGKDHSNKDLIWVSEIWDSKADHQSSLEDTRVRELIGNAMPIIGGMVDKGGEFEILGGLNF